MRDKAKKAAYDRARYLADRESRIIQATEWYEANRERKSTADKARREGPMRAGLLADKRAHYAANKERISASLRDSHYRRKYGISFAEKVALVEAQGGRCAICRFDLPVKGSHLDHDHATGRIRGVLCGPCNQALGLFRESPARLAAAIRYLTTPERGPMFVEKVAVVDREAEGW